MLERILERGLAREQGQPVTGVGCDGRVVRQTTFDVSGRPQKLLGRPIRTVTVRRGCGRVRMAVRVHAVIVLSGENRPRLLGGSIVVALFWHAQLALSGAAGLRRARIVQPSPAKRMCLDVVWRVGSRDQGKRLARGEKSGAAHVLGTAWKAYLVLAQALVGAEHTSRS